MPSLVHAPVLQTERLVLRGHRVEDLGECARMWGNAEVTRFFGEAGFAQLRREIDFSLKDAPEVGWALAPWAHGRGLATEAVRRILEWGDAHFDGAKTACLIDPGNSPSIRVAEKCGYRELERATYRGEPTVIFARQVA
jgi:RimJ/RimL family protein N-acetyltransferase